jgi:membrane-associated phospholipid phosphatase
MARALLATAAALAAFTAIVVGGAMQGVDNWAVNHVMPGLNPFARHAVVSRTGLWRPFPLDSEWWEKVLDTYLYPASFLISALIVTGSCLILARRGERVPAVVWFGAWVAANAAELAGKTGLERPDLHWTNGRETIPLYSFDSSYPSGHTTRAVVLAAIVAYVFPRLRESAAAWLVLVPFALVIAGDHTISDVVGGVFLGLLLVLAAHAMMRRWTRWWTSSSGSSEESSATQKPSSPILRAARSTYPTRS